MNQMELFLGSVILKITFLDPGIHNLRRDAKQLVFNIVYMYGT